MAVNLTKIPFLRSVTTRGYASSQVAPIGGICNYDIKNTTLPNKLVVSSADNESPISRVSIVFKAGSRNETAENLGVTHVIRICAGQSTKNASTFAITRNIQEYGASLSCTANRETIAYTLEGTRYAIEKCLPFLTEVATQQIFNPWEVSDDVPRLRRELSMRPPQFRAIDLLHKAAFRTGLGNSLYIAKYQLGKISSETLQHYVASNFNPARGAVVGLGVNHEQLVQYAQSLSLGSGDSSVPASEYKGGEIRSDKGGDFAYVTIAGKGGSRKNLKETIAFAVLQRALGIGPQVTRTPHDNAILSKAVRGKVEGDFAVSAVNACYSDTGLLGAIIAAPTSNVCKIVTAVVDVLKGGNVAEPDVVRAKNQLKTAILLDSETGSKTIKELGSQAALLGCAMSPKEIASAVDSITAKDVQDAFKKVSSSKLTIASVGNLSTVPYLDQLA